MKHLLIIFTIVLFCVNASSQDMIEVDHYFSVEAINETCYFSKFESITPIELSEMVSNRSSSRSDVIVENVQLYNAVYFRKLNNSITEIVKKYDNPNLVILHKRDVEENITNDIRFVIKSNMTAEDFLSEDEINPQFYVYDQKLQIRYKEYESIEELLGSLQKVNQYYGKKDKSTINQDQLDEFIWDNLPKARKPVPRGIIIALDAIIYGGMVYLINVLANK